MDPPNPQKPAINVGMSIQERMKMLNQKPSEEPKEKPIITTGVSVKDRLAALQQNSKTSQAEKPSFKPEEPFIPLSQRKASLQTTQKPVEEAKKPEVSALPETKAMPFVPKSNPVQIKHSHPDFEAFNRDEGEAKKEKEIVKEDVKEIEKKEEEIKISQIISSEIRTEPIADTSDPVTMNKEEKYRDSEEPAVVKDEEKSNNEILVKEEEKNISEEEIHKEEVKIPKDESHNFNKSESIKDRIQKMNNNPMPGLMGIRPPSEQFVAPVPVEKPIEIVRDDEDLDGKLSLSELDKPIRKRVSKRVEQDFEF